jgi:NhaP-type Na+/H+ or K+/H+ antiporter
VPPLALGIGIVAIVLTVAGLTSRAVQAAPISFPLIFLAIGFLLGGYGVIDVDVHSPMLEAVALISLALVLFLDAVNVQIDELRSEWYIPLLTLGPGTLLIVGGIAVAAFWLLGVSALQGVLLGAILASTDPIVLRDVLRDERIPRSVRRALSVESGMNDLVTLPVVLVLIALLTVDSHTPGEWTVYLARLFVLGPLVGLVVGGLGAWLVGRVDRWVGIGREYQALYGLGLVLACYAAGELLGSSGFLAAFFGGLSITLFNVTLCDCFMDYGEATAEMMMLLAFVLFGAVLAGMLPEAPLGLGLALAGLTLLVVRPLAMGLVLLPAKMSGAARLFIGWFGPRGLSSLLLALLVVHADVPQAELLFAVVGVVVVTSVVLHGVSGTPLASWYGGRVEHVTLNEEREATFGGLFGDAPDAVLRMTPQELAGRLDDPQPPIVLDVRSRAHYDDDATQIPHSVRVLPDQIEEWAAAVDRRYTIVAYCT